MSSCLFTTPPTVKALLHYAIFRVTCRIARQVARLHLATVSCDCTAKRKLLEIVAESGTVSYIPQRYLQLVSQRFRLLQGMLQWAMFRARDIAQCNRSALTPNQDGGHPNGSTATVTRSERRLHTVGTLIESRPLWSIHLHVRSECPTLTQRRVFKLRRNG